MPRPVTKLAPAHQTCRALTLVPISRRAVAPMSIEPEPGQLGDPKVLETLRAGGFRVEPIEATRKMRIDVAGVRAGSNAEASNRAMELVRRVIPSNGYHLAEYQVVHKELETASAGSR